MTLTHPEHVDLTLLARQLDELKREMRTLRDDVRAVTATLERIEGRIAGLLNELRAV